MKGRSQRHRKNHTSEIHTIVKYRPGGSPKHGAKVRE